MAQDREISDLADWKYNLCPGYPPKIVTLEQQLKVFCAILKIAPISVNGLVKNKGMM